MAPQIHLGPDGAERLWQHHYNNTREKKGKVWDGALCALATSSAFCIKAITVNKTSAARVVYGNDETMMWSQLFHLDRCELGRLREAQV